MMAVAFRILLFIAFLGSSLAPVAASEYLYHPSITLRLGAGLDPQNPLEPYPYCFSYGERLIPGTSGSAQFTLSQVTSRRDLIQRMGASVSLAGRYKFFSGGAQLSVDEGYTFSSDSLTWMIYSRVDMGRRELISEGPLPIFQAMLKNKSFDQFSQRCGKELVTQERREVVVAAIFSVFNVSEARQRTLQAALNASASVGVFSAEGSATYRNFVSEAAKSSAIALKVQTVGGPGGSSLAPLITDYGDIKKITEALRRYLADSNIENAQTVSYSAASMARYGWQGSAMNISGIDQALADYYVFYQDLVYIHERASSILREVSSGLVDLSDAELQSVRELDGQSEAMMRNVLSVATQCKSKFEACVPVNSFGRPKAVWPNIEPIGNVSIAKEETVCQDVGLITEHIRFMCTRKIYGRLAVRPGKLQSISVADDFGAKVDVKLSQLQNVTDVVDQARYIAAAVTTGAERGGVTRSPDGIASELGFASNQLSEWRIQNFVFEYIYGAGSANATSNARHFILTATGHNGRAYSREVYLN